MTVISDLEAHLIRLHGQLDGLSAFLADDAWLSRGLPQDGILRQMTIDNYWTVSTNAKAGMTESVTVFVSLWFPTGDNDVADRADDIARSVMEAGNLKRTPERLFIQATDRQLLCDAKSNSDRIRIRFSVQRI